jgi:hypothetical protein
VLLELNPGSAPVTTKPILPNEGTTVGFPKISQVSSIIIFIGVSSSKTHSMSNSCILVLMHYFTFMTSGKLIFL